MFGYPQESSYCEEEAELPVKTLPDQARVGKVGFRVCPSTPPIKVRNLRFRISQAKVLIVSATC